MSASTLPAERLPRLQTPVEAVEPVRRSYFYDLIRIAFPKQPDPLAGTSMFVAPHSGCGVSFLCSHIATELAQGNRVLLADASTLVALTHQDIDNTSQICERVEPGRVWVLGQQQLAKFKGDARVAHSSIAALLDDLKEEFSAIIIDAPALSDSDAALVLSTAVYGTILVAQAGHTSKRQIVDAHRRISTLGGRVLGSIYNSRD